MQCVCVVGQRHSLQEQTGASPPASPTTPAVVKSKMVVDFPSEMEACFSGADEVPVTWTTHA